MAGPATAGVLAAAEMSNYIVQMDGDRSDVSIELPLLLAPFLAGEADLVIGSRTSGQLRTGLPLAAATVRQLARRRACSALLYGVRVTESGPFRVIAARNCSHCGMREMTYGWSVEMIARAAQHGLRVREVPVTYRNRAGGRIEGQRQSPRLRARGWPHHRHHPALPH